MLWEIAGLFAVAVSLLLGAIYYLIRPLDRIKPLLNDPREYCDGQGIRSLMGHYRGMSVKFTASPYPPRYFTLTAYGVSVRELCEKEKHLRILPGADHPHNMQSRNAYPLSEAARLVAKRQKEALETLLGPLGFQRLEAGVNRIVLHTSNPSSPVFSRRQVRKGVLRTLDLLLVLQEDQGEPGPTIPTAQPKGARP